MLEHQSTGLEIDLYHMDAAYIAWKSGTSGDSTFELFTRRPPFGGGYMLTAGLELAAEHIQNFRYSDEDIEWFGNLKGYDVDFLDMLANLRFSGDILAMPEGEIAFPHQPIMRVDAPFVEAMLLESGLLRTIGISTLIATKAGRVHLASRGKSFSDFAFRRAHEPMWAARSAYIGGAGSSSYVAASRDLNIPGSGTIPHATIQAFPDEQTAFREIASLFPTYTLLIDTYDVDKGIDNAIEAAQNESAKGSGHKLAAVRIDSGDLGEWAKLVRSRLDAANMQDVDILVSGDIDEFKVESLLNSGAPIDGFGVGGNLGVGLGTIESGTVGGVIGAVYKLTWIDDKNDSTQDARMKIAGTKSTWPGRKSVYRIGEFDHDVIALHSEPAPEGGRPLLKPWMRNGRLVGESPKLDEIRDFAISNLASLPENLKALRVRDPYDVRFSDGIQQLRREIEALHS